MCWTYVRDCGVPLYHRREAGLGVEATPQNPQNNLKTTRKCDKKRLWAILGPALGALRRPPGVRGTTDDSLLAPTPASVRGLLFVNAHSKKCHNPGQKSNACVKKYIEMCTLRRLAVAFGGCFTYASAAPLARSSNRPAPIPRDKVDSAELAIFLSQMESGPTGPPPAKRVQKGVKKQ